MSSDDEALGRHLTEQLELIERQRLQVARERLSVVARLTRSGYSGQGIADALGVAKGRAHELVREARAAGEDVRKPNQGSG